MVVARERRHGEECLYWPPVERTNERGNTVLAPDLTATPIRTKAWLKPLRGSRAEVPGQQQIRTVEIGFPIELGPNAMYGRYRWGGMEWDGVTPPQYHPGTRHVRHWSITLRQRPS